MEESTWQRTADAKINIVKMHLLLITYIILNARIKMFINAVEILEGP